MAEVLQFYGLVPYGGGKPRDSPEDAFPITGAGAL